MRIAVLGGTRFIGVALIEELLAHGHEPLVIHRGKNERADQPNVPHAHIDRYDTPALARALDEFQPRAFVDTSAYTAADAEAACEALRDVPIVVLSSMDVYRAFHALRIGGEPIDAMPIDEESALRTGDQLYMFRGEQPIRGSAESTHLYENLDVERIYATREATMIRPGVVYGERDLVGREEFILRRIRAGRRQIPIGSGTLLWSRVYVRDVAALVRLAVESDAGAGKAFNAAERRTWTIGELARRIVMAADAKAEVVRVPDDILPPGMELTATFRQNVLGSSHRARATFGWEQTDPSEALARSVRWHLANPPADAADDFAADDRALAAANVQP